MASVQWGETLKIWLFGLTKIRLLFFTRPRVLELNERQCAIYIPLLRRNRNHLRSMYFGVLAVGADVAGGLIAMEAIRKMGNQVSLVFKDFQADFLKRPMSGVTFTCTCGEEIQRLVQKAINSSERENMPVPVIAKDKEGEEVARFVLTLSLKKKGSSA